MTPQEIFNKVAIHLRDQEGYAEYNNGDCGLCPAYIGPDGKQSGVGCLISLESYIKNWLENKEHNPDGMYELTNFAINELIDMKLLSEEYRQHIELLLDLDKLGCWENFDKSQWPFKLYCIAVKYNLKINDIIMIVMNDNPNVCVWK